MWKLELRQLEVASICVVEWESGGGWHITSEMCEGELRTPIMSLRHDSSHLHIFLCRAFRSARSYQLRSFFSSFSPFTCLWWITARYSFMLRKAVIHQIAIYRKILMRRKKYFLTFLCFLIRVFSLLNAHALFSRKRKSASRTQLNADDFSQKFFIGHGF